MKIEEISDIDIKGLQKKVAFSMLLFIAILFLSLGFIAVSYCNRVEIAKEHFICKGSKCKIIYLNKNDNIMPTPKRFMIGNELKPNTINRKNIDNIEMRHQDTAVTNRSVILGSREHAYYLRLLPKNLDKTNYEDYLLYNLIELGPISNEKYANEILEQLKNSIYTDKDIDIEIVLGTRKSFGD